MLNPEEHQRSPEKPTPANITVVCRVQQQLLEVGPLIFGVLVHSFLWLKCRVNREVVLSGLQEIKRATVTL